MITSGEITVRSDPASQLSSQDGQVATEKAKPVVSSHLTEQIPGATDGTPANVMANDAPLKARIYSHKARGKIAKFLRRYLSNEQTAEEKAHVDEKKSRALLHKQLHQESVFAEQAMINCLNRLKICSIQFKDGNIKKIRSVRFDKILLEPNALWFHVSNRLPFGTSYHQLWDQNTVNNLSMAVGHKVKVRWTEPAGVWYIIERASGSFGLPLHVNLVDMLNRMPKSKDFLSFPVGIADNSTPVYSSLDDMIHCIIGGTTGGGKSNFLNVILCTLLRRNDPERLQMILVDLKGGLEFDFYDGVPHLLKITETYIPKGSDEWGQKPIAPTGIINRREEIAPMLDWVIQEMDRRMQIMRNQGHKNIGEYNAHKRHGFLSHILVVIDEYADTKLLEHHGADVEDKIVNIAQRARAVGIHLVVCTQIPSSQILSTAIKANLPGKFAFNCADLQASMAILNNGHALNINPPNSKGRCVFRYEEERLLQTPFIPKDLIKATVSTAITGVAVPEKKHDVTQDEIREWALKENNGYLTQKPVWAHLRERGITAAEVKAWLAEMEGNEYLIGTQVYKVEVTGKEGARRLIIVEQKEESKPEAKPDGQVTKTS